MVRHVLDRVTHLLDVDRRATLGRERFEAICGRLKAASIGPITSATMHANGVDPTVEAVEHSIPGLVNAIKKHLLK